MDQLPVITPEKFVEHMAWLSFVSPRHPAAMMVPKKIIECAVWYFGKEARQLKIWVH